MDARYLGIDLGTTNTAAAVFDGETIELVRAADGGTLTPSVVRIDGKGRVTVGSKARKLLDKDPDNTRTEFKRLMGTDKALRFPAAGLDKRPEALAAEILRSVRADCNEQLGFQPERAVISVPALFELPQSAATSEAARLAGFERVELIQEPVASALAAGWSAEADGGGAWLVYDLGGGTFDVSLLETRDGLLRVVGHDGDNFLGGRDIDQAVVDWALARLGVDKADPRHATALRILRTAAEDAKIELTRDDEASLQLPALFDGEDVDVTLDRATLEGLMAPLVDRSVAVCRRLLARHGLTPDQLGKIVLVGGPTVMPFLRQRVRDALGAPFAEGLDPMTLVARGAAIYAATAGLDARPAVAEVQRGRRLWLQYPAMCSDRTPFVAGRLLDGDGPAPAEVRFAREDDRFTSDWVKLGADGGLVAMLELEPRRPNTFRVEGRDRAGAPVALLPRAITIVQGLTVSDPPLSRSVGVALANDLVKVYLDRGTPLPAKRTFVHQAVETVSAGADDMALAIPIVQGEHHEAHLCRLVGKLEIAGRELKSALPAGSEIELTIEIDRGGRLQARALVPRLEQVFEHVAHLAVPDADPKALAEQLVGLRARLGEVRRKVEGDPKALDRLLDVEWSLSDADQAITTARGGDEDAGQKARRLLIDADATLGEIEDASAWPEVEDRARLRVAWASQWVSQLGTPHEQRMLGEAATALERARAARRPAELERQLDVVRQLGLASYYRHPDAWRWEFEHAASDADRASDVPKARQLVREGRQAVQQGDRDGLRRVVQQLWTLMPEDPRERAQGYGSGLR